MISFLDGKIILKKDKFIILEVNSIGYKVFLSKLSLLKLPEIGETIKLFCFHNVKEDASDLYGFFTYDEMDFFEILMDIRGVGPKAALEISAVGPLDKIKDKILSQDAENALVQLGFSKQQAKEALSRVSSNIKNTEERIRLALKNLKR